MPWPHDEAPGGQRITGKSGHLFAVRLLLMTPRDVREAAGMYPTTKGTAAAAAAGVPSGVGAAVATAVGGLSPPSDLPAIQEGLLSSALLLSLRIGHLLL